MSTNEPVPTEDETPITTKSEQSPQLPEPVFGVNEIRLNTWQLLFAALIVILVMAVTPEVWKRKERFATGLDYRIPYALSTDYWLYQRRADKIKLSEIPVIGDSVVWGEYVLRDGTLSHFLTHESGSSFVNCGVNGVFPIALEGLVRQYGSAFANRKVILQCNMLWESSPKADLSLDSEATFNHSDLVPQQFGAVPCYRADAATRMGAFMTTHIGFYGWVNHIDACYYEQQSMPKWTLAESATDPPTWPNIWKNPFSAITMRVPGEPALDPLRGTNSRRHRAWNRAGSHTSHFEWVPLNRSLQWEAFQRLVNYLKSRHSQVLIILGPFNDHMIAPDQLSEYRSMRDAQAQWFHTHGVQCIVPNALPSELYADASHPLTEGYALLAYQIAMDPVFKSWMGGK